MKYIITESTFDKVVTKYLDDLFPEQEMKKFVYLDIDPQTLDFIKEVIFMKKAKNHLSGIVVITSYTTHHKELELIALL